MVTKQRLIQLIHIARNELGVDEDAYRQMLQGLTGKTSTKGMDTTQPNRVLEPMKGKGFRVKSARKASPGLPLDNHPQSRKIRVLRLEMATAGIVHDRSKNALVQWIKRETGISALRWFSTEQVSNVIEKLRKWQRRAAGVKHERPEPVSK